MTKGEARELFLRYLGAATVNGDAKYDGDLYDAFDHLICPAVIQVAAQFPQKRVEKVSLYWKAPEDLAELTSATNDVGMPVSYRRLGERGFIFSEACTVEYNRIPMRISPTDTDETWIDLDERAALLVPLRAAMDAAASTQEYAWKASFLTSAYNALADSIGAQNAVSRRTVYSV